MRMMTTTANQNPTLNNWLKAVNSHLQVRRIEMQAKPRPKRNRERERARREARQLFAQYYQELAIQGAA